MSAPRLVELRPEEFQNAAELRAHIEDVIASGDRVAIISVDRAEGGGTAIRTTTGSRKSSRTCWIELVGAVFTELCRWQGYGQQE